MAPIGVDMARNTARTAADSDAEYLDDVVVRAAMERLQRELADEKEVESIHSERFTGIGDQKTDYIKVNLKEHTCGNGHSLGFLVQQIADTGVARIDEINVDREYIRVAPSED
jgi:hypothetical protein